MCLLGMAIGVPRDEVLSDSCGGGVGERPGMSGGLATAAAMLGLLESESSTSEGTQRVMKHW